MITIKRLTSSVLALSLAATLGTGCKRRGESKIDTPALPSVPVRVQNIESKKHLATEDVVGTVRAKLQARLEAKVAGRIEEMRPVPGQTVQAGELLVRLDAQEMRARLEQAQAVRQQAESDLKRFTTLLERAAATRAEFEAVQARARVAEASLKEAQTMLGYAEVVAPFDGVVTRKLADVGDLATPGRPLLELEDPKLLRVEADVGEALVDRIKQGEFITVRVPTLAAPLQGTVAEIAPTSDPASRTFVVKLDLPPTSGLRVGTFARVAVPVGESAALRVPSEALIQRGQLEYIFVVVDGKAQLRLVKTGKQHGTEIELLAGAAAGERVVIRGAASLADGQPVEVKP